MADLSAIKAVSTETKDSSKALGFTADPQKKKQDSQNAEVAYASSVLPNLLNGSAQGPQQTASAFQA